AAYLRAMSRGSIARVPNGPESRVPGCQRSEWFARAASDRTFPSDNFRELWTRDPGPGTGTGGAMLRSLDIATSFATSMLRMPSGLSVGTVGQRPKKKLELYEFEACPFCRKVREALSMLDLSAMIYPCPKGGRRFRAHVKAAGGKEMFPYLV